MNVVAKKIRNDLVMLLLTHGKLGKDKEQIKEVMMILDNALETKIGVIEKVQSVVSYRKPILNICAFLTYVFRDLPDKPEPKTISQEIEDENNDFVNLQAEPLFYGFTNPKAASLMGKPSILECQPYNEYPLLWASNTYIAVKEEAKQENTSMHEICRRKGLVYELLII